MGCITVLLKRYFLCSLGYAPALTHFAVCNLIEALELGIEIQPAILRRLGVGLSMCCTLGRRPGVLVERGDGRHSLESDVVHAIERAARMTT